MNLSIIIPVYNKSEYLTECIESVQRQSLKDSEIICVDDGSTDGSAELVSEFQKTDGRVRLIRQQNLGAGAARNAGVKAAKGEYVAFLDADDFYSSKDTLARIYAAAKSNNALICGGSFCEIRSDERVIQFDGVMSGNKFDAEGWVDFKDYQFDYGFYRFIYNRDFLIKNNLIFPDYLRYQDPPFMLRAFDAAGRFYAIPDVTYCYRVNDRPVDWTTEKVLDLLCGIKENFKFSAARGYERVHALNYYRLCNDFCGAIVDIALRQDSDGKILKKLVEIQSDINAEMIQTSGLFTDKENKFSKPLSELIQKLSAQSAQLYNEGWFINKKLFRVYTSPVRMFGKALRNIKHRK